MLTSNQVLQACQNQICYPFGNTGPHVNPDGSFNFPFLSGEYELGPDGSCCWSYTDYSPFTIKSWGGNGVLGPYTAIQKLSLCLTAAAPSTGCDDVPPGTLVGTAALYYGANFIGGGFWETHWFWNEYQFQAPTDCSSLPAMIFPLNYRRDRLRSGSDYRS